jgi:serine protease
MFKRILFSILSFVLFFGATWAKDDLAHPSQPNPDSNSRSQAYACEEDLIEVMFAQDSKIRLQKGGPVDLSTNALAGLDEVLQKFSWFEWSRICDVPEERLDEVQAQGEANTGKSVYNLNNIYRLRIPEGHDVWAVSQELERLPGIILARPVPRPMPLPTPPNYVPSQGYLYSASSTPVGIDANYAWTQTGGNGAGVTVCDLEYSWNYNHADITKAPGSQINPNPIADPFSDNNHGTAVIGELVSDNNGWGTTGICYGASLKTCGTYYPASSPSWNVPGAIAYAIANLSPGDVILLEQQWAYTGTDYIPIEWWLNYSPNPQTFNGVYAAIVNAVSNGIHVVEAGGNGNVNTDALTWYGNSGAIIVGAGGAYPGGSWPEGDLQRLSFSSHGSRFDLQGWGEDVVTTGYGSLYNSEGVNYWYTNTFSGTSSASPIVAGAVTCCVGYWKAYTTVTPPSPVYLRTLLKNTGTPQVTPPSGTIGPRPNLQSAFSALFIRGDVNRDGKINLSDVIYLANYVLKAGLAPVPLQSGDCNCDGNYNLVDVILLANYVIKGQPFPC